MSSNIENGEKKKDKMPFFGYFTEIMGWLQIFVSPFLIGLVIAAFIYFPNPTTVRLVIAIGIALLGTILGIIFATRIWKKQGTINFISSIMSTPELDKLDEEKSINSKS